MSSSKFLQNFSRVACCALLLACGCGRRADFETSFAPDDDLAPSATATAPETPTADASVALTADAATPSYVLSEDGTRVEFARDANFRGFSAEDAARATHIKVARGAGLLSRDALLALAKAPNLVEFLWTDAQMNEADADAFAALVDATGSKLKKIRLAGLKKSNGEGFPDGVLDALAFAPSLVDLDVSGSAVSADQLARVCARDGAFARLQKLNLYGATVGDAGVDAILPLASLEQLTNLNLDATGITPSSASKIARFKNLVFLHVGRSTIDDASLAEFAKLSKLEKIHITRTRATEEGAAALRGALPNCVVISQPEN